MPNIQQLNEIIQPEIKRLFDSFFKDKYNPEERESILIDLFEMIRNELIEEIHFCLFDSVEQKIVNGYTLKINSNQSSNYILPKNYEFVKLNTTSTTEKFCILKLKESIDNNEIQKKLNELKNDWNFLKQPEIKTKAEKKQLLWIEDFNIEIQEIKNE